MIVGMVLIINDVQSLHHHLNKLHCHYIGINIIIQITEPGGRLAAGLKFSKGMGLVVAHSGVSMICRRSPYTGFYQWVDNMKFNRILLFILSFALLVVFFNAGKIQATDSKESAGPTLQKITIAVSTDTVPFHFSDDQGRPSGIIVDMWRLWSQKTGVAIEFKSAPWNDTIAMVRDGRADAHAGLNYNSDREKFLDFGKPLTRSDSFFFFDKNIYGLNTIDDLIPFRIGIIKGAHEASILKAALPQAALVEYADQKSN